MRDLHHASKTSQIAVVLLDARRASTRKIRESARKECDARSLERVQDDDDKPRRTRVIPVVDRSKFPSFIIAFGTVEVVIILSVLGLHVNRGHSIDPLGMVHCASKPA